MARRNFPRLLLAAQVLAAGSLLSSAGAAPDRWRLDAPGRRITWALAKEAGLPHADRIEMTGRRVSGIVTYGADARGSLQLERTIVWPTLRVAPNNTHASFTVRFQRDQPPRWLNGRDQALAAADPGRFEPAARVAGQAVVGERLERAAFQDGILRLDTRLQGGLRLERELFPSREGRAFLERWTLRNAGARPVVAGVEPCHLACTLPFSYVDKGLQLPGQPSPAPVTCTGTYVVAVACEGLPDRSLAPGASVSVGVAFQARPQTEPDTTSDFQVERDGRARFARDLQHALRLECPDPVLSTLFDFSKLRACESIIATKHGPMHAPGGADYYAAIWANDTLEYAAPLYPFTGYAYGVEASLNAITHFSRYMNPDFQPIPSSIVAEGTDTWHGAGDRGDQAMLAFGVARFLLALGDRAEAERHWPLVAWCLDYCERMKTKDGVIASRSDELEGRFSSGHVNLNTNMLTYGALRSAADLARDLGKGGLAATYRARASALDLAMEAFFGADLRGFHTYRYHDGLEELRSWICIPLTMGIDRRKEGTLGALFSPRLWTADGLLTAEGSTTFWDRSTLYALRGVFNAGAPDTALPALAALSRRRLLGEHVPYVVEAYPEGEGRHLSAESALYARVVTEGLFGITPTGFRSFRLQPSLPSAWKHMALRRVRAFGSEFDVEIRRAGQSRIALKVVKGKKVILDRTAAPGEAVAVVLS